MFESSHSSIINPTSIDTDNDLVVIGFSSGTTGKPKPVPRTHNNILSMRDLNNPGFEFIDHHDIVSCHPPLCHTGGLSLLVIPLYEGATVVILDGFEIENFISYVHIYKVSSFLMIIFVN